MHDSYATSKCSVRWFSRCHYCKLQNQTTVELQITVADVHLAWSALFAFVDLLHRSLGNISTAKNYLLTLGTREIISQCSSIPDAPKYQSICFALLNRWAGLVSLFSCWVSINSFVPTLCNQTSVPLQASPTCKQIIFLFFLTY